ncbi:helix-turn-helix domain-containing protein [Micromonospora profundi]|uniref:helix-turn-helix domain-containing protein n=1 Tax=Micromonospora profundi TaxID=1420889 RepID=UPI00364CB556
MTDSGHRQGSHPSAGPGSGSVTFAGRLQALFDERLKKDTEKKFTPEEVSAATGLSVSYLNYLLSGERDNPTMKNIQRLADFWGVSPSYFFDSVEPADHASAPEADPDLAQITVLARNLPPGMPRATLRAIVEQVAALEARRNPPPRRGGRPGAT